MKEASVTLAAGEFTSFGYTQGFETLKFALDTLDPSGVVVSLDGKILFRLPLDILQAVIRELESR